MDPAEERSEIAFFDLETTRSSRAGQVTLLEFGAILVCPTRLVELSHYSTLIGPAHPSLPKSFSDRRNGITQDAVNSAPSFAYIADIVFDILHGRIWAGHNIVKFDSVIIKEAFAEIGRPAPEPKATIDSLSLLTQRFGRRAGDMKMASLAAYFRLGEQTHRSLEDVRMNLEVIKNCATVLFLESSLPDILTVNSGVYSSAATRSRSSAAKSSFAEGTSQHLSPPVARLNLDDVSNSPPSDQKTGKDHPILSLLVHSSDDEVADLPVSNTNQSDPCDMHALGNQMKTNLQQDVTMEEKPEPQSSEIIKATLEGSSGNGGYIEPEEVSIPYITASFFPLFNGSEVKIPKLLHKGVFMQLCCPRLKVRFGISTRFPDNAGRPKLNFVVDSPPSLSRVLDACDDIAQKVIEDSGSNSEWRHVLTKKSGFFPTARLHIPTEVIRDVPQYATEMHQKEASGTVQKLIFHKFDPAELDSLFKPTTVVDVFISLDLYDYQKRAGIRLVAKKLIFHSD